MTCRITTETQGYYIGRHYCHAHDVKWDGAFAVGGGCPRTEVVAIPEIGTPREMDALRTMERAVIERNEARAAIARVRALADTIEAEIAPWLGDGENVVHRIRRALETPTTTTEEQS